VLHEMLYEMLCEMYEMLYDLTGGYSTGPKQVIDLLCVA